MTVFMPPIQRKKKVVEKYSPDSFRVISELAVSDHPKFNPRHYTASFEPRTPTPKASQFNNNAFCEAPLGKVIKNTRVLPQILPDYRQHKPQTKSCHFLDKNVKFFNEPICHVYTAGVGEDRDRWWPARANPGTLAVPPYTEDTHYRKDYNYRRGERPFGSGRHAANVNREAARGVVPVNHLREKDGSQRFYKEGLSYEHIYNCRDDANYPIRGKRQGAFVWNRMDPLSQKKFVEYYQRLEQQEQTSPSQADQAQGTAAVVVRSSNNSNAATPKRNSASSVTSGKSVMSAQVCECSDATQVSPQDQTVEVKQEPEVNVGGESANES